MLKLMRIVLLTAVAAMLGCAQLEPPPVRPPHSQPAARPESPATPPAPATATVPAAATQPVSSIELPPYRRVVLDNGLVVLLMEQHEVPLIDLYLIVRSSHAGDPPGKQGVAWATAQLLTRGAAGQSAVQIAEELDYLGGAMGFSVGNDYTSGSAQFLAKDIAAGVDLFSRVLLRPEFPKDEVDKLVRQQIDRIKSIRDEPGDLTARCHTERLYGDHPYGRWSSGYEKTLATIHPQDLKEFHAARYVANNAILAITGDFDAAKMEGLVRGKLGGWPRGTPPQAAAAEPARTDGRTVQLIDNPDATQTYFRLGMVGFSRSEADAPHMDVVNTLLGGRFTSMLNTELRINRGLTYNVSSDFGRYRQPGHFTIATFTGNEHVAEALQITLEVLARLHKQGVTDEDLASAKAYILGQSPLMYETSGQLASTIADLEYHGRGPDYIRDYYAKVAAMTVEDARRAIDRFFPKEAMLITLVGPRQQIEAQVKKVAPKIEVKDLEAFGF